jgi:drug/metabolite transporter superfamily protein YnfA
MGWILGSIGGFILFLYSVVPTFQPSHFHRTYAAYGGIIIAGIPAKSIKHKVTSDKLFLMAGQEQKQQLTDIKAELSSTNQ